MEELFTRASMAVELFGFGYVAGSFVVYTHHRLTQAAQWKPRSTEAITQTPLPLEQPKPEKKRKLSPVELLRQQCQNAGIKWRHAHGKNKHLKKAEMIEALQKLEQSKREQSKKIVVTPSKPAIAADQLRKVA